MTSEMERIEEQLRLSFEGEAWHGPSVLEALVDVTHHEAAAHPISGAHSIWELALHLTGTYRLVLRRLGGDGTQLSTEDEWPPVPPATEAAWADTLQFVRRMNRDVRQAIHGFPAERLSEPLVTESPYTAYTQFIGITQHDLYHAGQMVLLKRALRTERADS